MYNRIVRENLNVKIYFVYLRYIYDDNNLGEWNDILNFMNNKNYLKIKFIYENLYLNWCVFRNKW